jgi:hypothetical protein
LISEHTPSSVKRFVDVSFIRASCANFGYTSCSTPKPKFTNFFTLFFG